ncbi:MAG TPA: class I SAM-dependent methyltransferase [Bryobacteraceae bacterium]|nr:class I SAM-dependent methyltransferase [Bryobacteraceae bacterium]
MLVPLFARAVESTRKRPILVDPRAVGIAETVDWDFTRFNQRKRVIGCVIRTVMFDELVREFLRRHPAGTVVEIGAGLNTRFERLDNQSLRWFDVELPAVADLRRKYFPDSARRTLLASSILEGDWIAAVRRAPAPYFFVAETVLIYLPESDVKAALAQIAHNFPGANLALDTGSRRVIESGNKDFVRRKMAARFAWACEDPRSIENWQIGLRVVESRGLDDIRDPWWSRLPLFARASIRLLAALAPNVLRAYRLNLFEALPHS